MLAAFFWRVYTFLVEFFNQKKLKDALKEQEEKIEELERELEERDLEIERVQMLNDRLHSKTQEVEDIDDRRWQIYYNSLDKVKRYRKLVEDLDYEIKKLKNEKCELQSHVETLNLEILNLNYERNEEMVQQRHRWAYDNNILTRQINFTRKFVEYLQKYSEFQSRKMTADCFHKVDNFYSGLFLIQQELNTWQSSSGRNSEPEPPSTPSSQLTKSFEDLENIQLLSIDTGSPTDLTPRQISSPPGLDTPQDSSVSFSLPSGRLSPPKFDINNLEDFPEL